MEGRIRVPYEYFIKFLISSKQDTNAVNRSLESYGFQPVPDEYVARLRTEIAQPRSFRASRSHKPSMAWLVKQQIRSLWFRDEYPDVLQAFDILSRPNIRKIVDAMTLLPVGQDQIAEVMGRRYNYPTHPSVIRTYALYFNNFSIMSPDDRRDYLLARREPWKLAVLQGDVLLLKLHLGWQVTMTARDILTSVQGVAFRKIMDLDQLPTNMMNAKAFQSYKDGLQWTMEELQKHEAGASKIFDLLKMRQDELGQEVYAEELPSGHMVALPTGEGSSVTPEEVKVQDDH